MAYDNIKSHRKPGFHPLSRKKTLFEHKYLTNYSTVAEQ